MPCILLEKKKNETKINKTTKSKSRSQGVNTCGQDRFSAVAPIYPAYQLQSATYFLTLAYLFSEGCTLKDVAACTKSIKSKHCVFCFLVTPYAPLGTFWEMKGHWKRTWGLVEEIQSNRGEEGGIRLKLVILYLLKSAGNCTVNKKPVGARGFC